MKKVKIDRRRVSMKNLLNKHEPESATPLDDFDHELAKRADMARKRGGLETISMEQMLDEMELT